MSVRKFVRIFTDLPNEYPEVYDDAETLGTYVQLLMLADRMYPMKAQLPRAVADAPLDALTTAGLVILEEWDRFTIKGLAKQREAESEGGRISVQRRWAKQYPDRYLPDGRPRDANRDPGRYPNTTRRDDTKRDETSRARESGDSGRDVSGKTNGVSPHLRVDSGGLQPLSEYITGAGTASSLKDRLVLGPDGQWVAAPEGEN